MCTLPRLRSDREGIQVGVVGSGVAQGRVGGFGVRTRGVKRRKGCGFPRVSHEVLDSVVEIRARKSLLRLPDLRHRAQTLGS